MSEAWSLTNGIRVVSIYFLGSTNVSIFTYSPMGLGSDGPKQTQWSHLVEHLVIRSTVANDLSIANAETLPDHMRLDYYANTSNWKEGLSHHRRWLEGVPFTDRNVVAEKPKVKAECDYAAGNLATHKFAWAAWAQGVRHGATFASLKGDVDRASLAEIQAYRDAHLAVLSNVVVCVVGGVAPDEVRGETSRQFEPLQSKARLAAAVKPLPGKHNMTWDLKARHLLLSWPIPNPEDPAFAALFAAAQRLTMLLFSDQSLQKLAGQTFAGADMRSPEGSFFYISSSVRPGGSFQEVQDLLMKHVSDLNAPGADLSWASLLGQQSAQQLNALPDIDALSGQLPPNVSKEQVEMNLGLQWGMMEFRYRNAKLALVRALSNLKAENVLDASKKYLTASKCSVVTLQPEQP